MRLLGGACCTPVAEFLKIFADSRAARGGHQPPPAPLLRRRPFLASARQRCVWGSASMHALVARHIPAERLAAAWSTLQFLLYAAVFRRGFWTAQWLRHGAAPRSSSIRRQS
jgi:hypothetical protein